ncbi:aconitate hydratase AcnA [bacterium (Candidatus Blackallbacteria) CG17_big_fil_post_rev_8_21_14_2_50_48_46]|uniref:Aconitate hydratase n=1 Tax=bacterium (Candidatus Blackallbacteria) CG17_big_fil_post_rev_8_21_14_2_50_48_46 TaxID=2014261 RepID=A0A2M7G217_9BACT|nr:MAG: aconitate hydratase AcnA [bacterium (Candidatus Blackallbacteria) CG18_big_fil_WC_8_21_14_2_50_49_26]PIW15804.1 MAG: aconitate hydratase AcnA [bacterium (Candidatus Blackallbacteria) CG17_big_fil_post_rev_8_21_14_2_50_48_46]PIW47789.1 MAG: aconitate hydratase AcnA [bacterium (Candidatus Blackallbacteria) CG13_big_fil_rev_8_21_14_2_50_49_14]
MSTHDLLGTRTALETGAGISYYYSLSKLADQGYSAIHSLPFSIKVLLESVLRNCDDYVVSREDVKKLATYNAAQPVQEEIPFKPARVILQDFTGVPAVVDLAAMRAAMARMGGDPKKINPICPVDLVIDHSVQVDYFGQSDSFSKNIEKEMERNRERYEFLRWGQQALDNFGVVPPGRGIVHQVNLEYLARGVWSSAEGDDTVAYPDSLVGTDSHTTMINGLGVVGWGVGGIEAEAVMLGQPIYMLIPEVIGFKLTGSLPEGVTATDLTLTITQMLRKKGVVGKFVEFYGSGLSNISLPDRATIANMAPEYGATMGFFPIDAESLRYLSRSGRSADLVSLVEAYSKAQGLFRTDETADPVFTDTLELDMSTVQPSLAGPKRPQDRVPLNQMQETFRSALTSTVATSGFSLSEDKLGNTGVYADQGQEITMKHGDVVIAAITSCTNTSNPSVLLAAGLVAKKAVAKGLKVKPYVKTSLAPGSRVVTEYLDKAGLSPYLNQLGFNLVGYGCTTCIGNSGPLPDAVEKAIKDGDLIAASVLSGNRNFEGRVHQSVKANFLASPPLVVAYALAGTVDIDLVKEALGTDSEGQPVYLKDIWPSNAEIAALLDDALNPELFNQMYNGIAQSNQEWNAIPVTPGDLYAWNDSSTYIQEPPFFVGMAQEPGTIQPINEARVLVKVGDSITTDHISPAGAIKVGTPAAQYLVGNSVQPGDFNSYGSRRGNDRVMTRGTFANVRLKNQMAPGTEGGYTTYLPSNEQMFIYEASEKYQQAGTPLVILAGKEYGTGSSRDWAAKGTFLLGVRAVIAESFERIHRSNLVGMGVLPLQFKEGENPSSLGLDGSEFFSIVVDDQLKPQQMVQVTARKANGESVNFDARCRIDTPVEVDYYRNGGILQTVLRQFMK